MAHWCLSMCLCMMSECHPTQDLLDCRRYRIMTNPAMLAGTTNTGHVTGRVSGRHRPTGKGQRTSARAQACSLEFRSFPASCGEGHGRAVGWASRARATLTEQQQAPDSRAVLRRFGEAVNRTMYPNKPLYVPLQLLNSISNHRTTNAFTFRLTVELG